MTTMHLNDVLDRAESGGHTVETDLILSTSTKEDRALKQRALRAYITQSFDFQDVEAVDMYDILYEAQVDADQFVSINESYEFEPCLLPEYNNMVSMKSIRDNFEPILLMELRSAVMDVVRTILEDLYGQDILSWPNTLEWCDQDEV